MIKKHKSVKTDLSERILKKILNMNKMDNVDDKKTPPEDDTIKPCHAVVFWIIAIFMVGLLIFMYYRADDMTGTYIVAFLMVLPTILLAVLCTIVAIINKCFFEEVQDMRMTRISKYEKGDNEEVFMVDLE